MTYSRAEIMDIAKDTSQSFDETLSQLINIGLEELELQLGIISEISGDSYTVIHTNNPDLLGQEFALGVTYCSITLSLVAKRVFAVKKFSVSEYFRHPAYEAFQLESYIGAPIMVKKRQFGTINFTQPIERTQDFTSEEKQLVKNLSEGIGYVLGIQEDLSASTM